jgi:Family of unknown function (DUF6069)
MSDPEKLDLDVPRYLSAGLAVSVVAGGASYVAYLIGTVFSSDPLAVPAHQGSDRLVELSGADAFWASFVAGVVATAVLWVLILVVPTPTRFFAWIAGLFAIAVTVLPFSFTDALSLENKIWLAAINLVGALTIISLLLGIVPRVVRHPNAFEPSRTP